MRLIRGGTPASAEGAHANLLEEMETVEVQLNVNGRWLPEHDGGGELDTPRDVGDFLFLARSSQPGSIGHQLQLKGVRFFPREAFLEYSTPQPETRGERSSSRPLSRCTWSNGQPLPSTIPMNDLPMDADRRVHLVMRDPCGPDHPLMRAVGGEFGHSASVEVLNFPQASPRSRDDGVESDMFSSSPAFDELRSAVVFRRWFSVHQQQAIADAVAAQVLDGGDPGLSTDRVHMPLMDDRAALAAISEGMLEGLSSEPFSELVERRTPPIPPGASRDFTAVCYGKEAIMGKHRDTWKEWTLIVSLGNTVVFELGAAESAPDTTLELASGEGLLFNGHELYHEVKGVREGTAPSFWGDHLLYSRGGFARVGLLSLKGFTTRGVDGVDPRWGPADSSGASRDHRDHRSKRSGDR